MRNVRRYTGYKAVVENGKVVDFTSPEKFTAVKGGVNTMYKDENGDYFYRLRKKSKNEPTIMVPVR